MQNNLWNNCLCQNVGCDRQHIETANDWQIYSYKLEVKVNVWMLRKMFHFQVMARHCPASPKKWKKVSFNDKDVCGDPLRLKQTWETSITSRYVRIWGPQRITYIYEARSQGYQKNKKVYWCISAYRHMKTDNQLHSQSFSLHENLVIPHKSITSIFLKEPHWGYKTTKYYNHITTFLPQHQLINCNILYSGKSDRLALPKDLMANWQKPSWSWKK